MTRARILADYVSSGDELALKAPLASPTFTGTVSGIPTFDDTAIRQDINVLALREAVTENRVAYNLPNSFIDQFQDDSGIGTETNVDRDATEYVGTNLVAPANVILLLHMDDTGLTDSSPNNITTNVSGSFARSATQSKFGSYSAHTTVAGSGYFYTNTFSGATVAAPTTGDWTIDLWYYPTAWTNYQRVFGQNSHTVARGGSASQMTAWSPWVGGDFNMHGVNTTGEEGCSGAAPTSAPVLNTWIHLAMMKKTGELYFYYNGYIYNGTSNNDWDTTDFSSTSYMQNFNISGRSGSTGEMIDGYIDEVRYSNIARYTTGLDASQQFTPETSAYAGTQEATGTLIGNANVPSSAQTKVSGVMLYKDNAGTATIGTDLEIYFTCNGGTNWTEAASYTAVTPVFSTGIKMVKLGETTCTSGSDVRYKAVWANQAAAKLTQLHGIGLNY